jgi:hypothetical protein
VLLCRVCCAALVWQAASLSFPGQSSLRRQAVPTHSFLPRPLHVPVPLLSLLRFGDPHDIGKFQSYPLLQSEVRCLPACCCVCICTCICMWGSLSFVRNTISSRWNAALIWGRCIELYSPDLQAAQRPLPSPSIAAYPCGESACYKRHRHRPRLPQGHDRAQDAGAP